MPAWTERLEKLDRRIIFVFILFFVSLPLFVHMELPIPPSPEVQHYFEAVDRLKAGDIVFFPADFDPGSLPEVEPMMRATLRHLFRKNVRAIVFTLWETGPGAVDRILEDEARRAGKEYGKDYVFLGYKAGREVIMVQTAQNIRGVFPQDYTNRPVAELPLMNDANRLADCRLIVNISSGYPGTKEWVQQVRTRFDVPMVSGCTAVSTPEYFPYYQSGQLSGLLGGLAGAARYEKLVGYEGAAARGMPPQSLGHIGIVAFILLGNALYFVNRRGRGAGRPPRRGGA